jgi:hypothetical protein
VDASVIEQTIFAGRNNALRLLLLSDGEPLADLSGLTRAVLKIGDAEFDSAAGASLRWDVPHTIRRWDADAGAWVDVAAQAIEVAVGTDAQLPPPGRYPGCSLVTFDADHPAGIEWAGATRLDVVVA